MKIRIAATIQTSAHSSDHALTVEHTAGVLGFGMKFPSEAHELTPEQVDALEVAFDTEWKMARERVQTALRALRQDADLRLEELERAELEMLRRNPTGLTLGEEETLRLEELEIKFSRPSEAAAVEEPAPRRWRAVAVEDGRFAEDLPELGIEGGSLVLYPEPREMVAAVELDLTSASFFGADDWQAMLEAGVAVAAEVSA